MPSEGLTMERRATWRGVAKCCEVRTSALVENNICDNLSNTLRKLLSVILDRILQEMPLRSVRTALTVLRE